MVQAVYGKHTRSLVAAIWQTISWALQCILIVFSKFQSDGTGKLSYLMSANQDEYLLFSYALSQTIDVS